MTVHTTYCWQCNTDSFFVDRYDIISRVHKSAFYKEITHKTATWKEAQHACITSSSPLLADVEQEFLHELSRLMKGMSRVRRQAMG